jgi:hypothetical protein
MPPKKGTNTKTSDSGKGDTDIDTKQTHQVSLPVGEL